MFIYRAYAETTNRSGTGGTRQRILPRNSGGTTATPARNPRASTRGNPAGQRARDRGNR